jgi:GDP-4-dehydro-6-deoxy-D-mannose reductase
MDKSLKKILITGSQGFTGRKLSVLLESRNNVIIYYTGISCSNECNNFYPCDLRDSESVYRMIEKILPDQIYHLAGSFDNIFSTDIASNVLTTQNILESVQKIERKVRILLVGSAAEYGLTESNESPIKETHPLNPASIYGLTKVYQTYLMKLYFESFNQDVVMVRPFNLYGEGISTKLFVGRLYQQIEKLRNKKIDKIRVGNINNKRDYISIEDAISHYERVMEFGEKGEVYNIGSGNPIKTSVIMNEILIKNGINLNQVESNCTKYSKDYDVQTIYADIRKINSIW